MENGLRLKHALLSLVNKESIVLDVGAGPYKQLARHEPSFKKYITLDAWANVNPDVLADLNVAGLPFKTESVDLIIMLDFIEHLDKEAGLYILEEAKRVTRKYIVLLTPIKWDSQEEAFNLKNKWSYQNPYIVHLSHWTLDDFSGWESFECLDVRKSRHHLVLWEKTK